MKDKTIKPGISAVLIVYHEEPVIKETLESIKGIVNEIIVVHDGPCKDNTVKIAREYTKKVYETPHTGRSAFNFITGLERTQYEWILKIDGDEPLSPKLQKNLRSLPEQYPGYDGFSFIHPRWDGTKPITKYWPRKTSFVKKEKISYLAFPGWDASIPIIGAVKKTDLVLLHKPIKNQDMGWKDFKTKVLGRYAQSQAKYLLMNFKDFDTYNYQGTDLPLKIRIRKHLPLITNFLYGLLVFTKQYFKEGAWKEGTKSIDTLTKTLIYNTYLGWLITKEKNKQRRQNKR